MSEAIQAAELVGEPRNIVVLAVPHTSLLEAAGPLEVFALVEHKLKEAGRTRARPYRVHLLSATEGLLEPGVTGVPIQAQGCYADFEGPIDTLLVLGGLDVWDGASADLLSWIRDQAGKARRYGSICTGIFPLAQTGLLDGHRVTTHWYFCERLAREFPGLTVDPDPIYIREGALSTAAGVTSGIDLALSMVEEDVGIDIATRVARGLVLYVRRPGWLSQFSSSLALQTSSKLSFRDLPFWIIENLAADLSVDALAGRASMSPRNFARRFVEEFGIPPARLVADLRAETALRMIDDTDMSREAIAESSGMGSVDSMERAIASYRRRKGGPAEPAPKSETAIARRTRLAK